MKRKANERSSRIHTFYLLSTIRPRSYFKTNVNWCMEKNVLKHVRIEEISIQQRILPGFVFDFSISQNNEKWKQTSIRKRQTNMNEIQPTKLMFCFSHNLDFIEIVGQQKSNVMGDNTVDREDAKYIEEVSNRNANRKAKLNEKPPFMNARRRYV